MFSGCGTYRYSLSRRFGSGAGRCVFIMLNPSRADATVADPTIRRCTGFAWRWGRSGLRVVNLFALRTAKRAVLLDAESPVGPLNDEFLADELERLSERDLLLCAWGNDGGHMGRSTSVRRMIRESGKPAYCLGTNAGGEPVHPLYIPAKTLPVPFSPSAKKPVDP